MFAPNKKQVDQIEFEINEISNYNHVLRCTQNFLSFCSILIESEHIHIFSISVVEVFGLQ